MSTLKPLSDTYFHFYTCVSSNSLLKNQLNNSEDPMLVYAVPAYAMTVVLDVHVSRLEENTSIAAHQPVTNRDARN